MELPRERGLNTTHLRLSGCRVPGKHHIILHRSISAEIINTLRPPTPPTAINSVIASISPVGHHQDQVRPGVRRNAPGPQHRHRANSDDGIDHAHNLRGDRYSSDPQKTVTYGNTKVDNPGSSKGETNAQRGNRQGGEAQRRGETGTEKKLLSREDRFASPRCWSAACDDNNGASLFNPYLAFPQHLHPPGSSPLPSLSVAVLWVFFLQRSK